MAKFMIKASELKNVCKAVNDRKLADLKKEIIEILKKQDEKDFKKATDYLNSQEEHFTHLEKSLSGKWIEKAGYGIGTVRVWKGKKYKKIAPNKWVRVFDKEGRGTNVSIGKLISKVQKCKSVEELMALAMANKSRFVDENGNDLPILDKLRAEIDIKNEKLSGESSSYTYGVGEDVSREKNKIFEGKEKITKEEADLHKVARKFSQMPTTELKQRKAKLERWIENKTRNKRDSLNNAIFRESYQKELDAINAVLDKRSPVKAEKTIEDKIKENPDYPFKPKTEKERAERASFEKDRDEFIERMDKIREENKKKAEKKTVDYSKMSEDELKELTSKLHDKLKEKDYDEVDEEMEQINAIGKQQAINFYKTKEKHTLQHVEGADQKKKMIADSKAITEKELARKEKQKAKETNIAKKNNLVDEIKELKHKILAFEQLAKEIEDEPAEKEEPKTYWIQNRNGVRLTNDNAKQRIKDSFEQIKAHEKLLEDSIKNEDKPTEISARTTINLEYEKAKDLYDKLNSEDRKEFESEFEKYKNRSEAMKGNKNAYKGGVKDIAKPSTGVYAPSESTDLETKKAIAENKSIGENEVQMPYSKELDAEMKTLKNCVSRDPAREWMQHIYYDNGNLVATDGRRVKAVKVGKLDGIENGSFVDIDISKDGVNIKKRDGMEGAKFPEYNRVIPDDLSQKVTLNNKVIKDKIKEMKKDGAIDKKTNRIQLEFKDGKVYLDDTEIGEAKNINLKYSDDWGPAREETNFISVNADYFENALTGNSSTLMLGERADKAMGISTDSTTNIVMPMNGTNEKIDYSAGRNQKAEDNAKKDKQKSEYRQANQDFIDSIKERKGERYKKVSDSAANDLENRMAAMDNDTLKLNYDRLNFNLDKVLDKKQFITENTNVDKKLKLDLNTAILYQTLAENHPEVISKFADELNKRGITVKKSLFDGFLGLELFEEDIDDIEEEKEEESLWNDYSAEQPELFNSVELQVCEAMNRHYGNCL